MLIVMSQASLDLCRTLCACRGHRRTRTLPTIWQSGGPWQAKPTITTPAPACGGRGRTAAARPDLHGDLAAAENIGVIGKGEHEIEIVLDDQDRRLAARCAKPA
jgi:hypothetical protein